MHGIRRCYLAPTLFALFATLWQSSCLAADEAIVSRIEAMEAGFPVQVLGNRLMAHQALSAFYGANGYQRVWQSAELRRQLIDSVEQASDDGLNPADYHADILSGLTLRPMSDFSEDLRADLDLLFSDAFLILSSHSWSARSTHKRSTPSGRPIGANARWNPFCGMRWSAQTSPAPWIRCGHPIPPTES